MDEMNHDRQRSIDLQQRWHGWGSPVGLGMGVMFVLLGLSAILWASSLYV